MSQKVKINSATYDEIRALPYIKDEVARNIVADRAANGHFSGPSDLARVTGVGKKLPGMLSSYIDWSPPAAPAAPKARQWALGALFFILLVLLPVVIAYPPYAELSGLWDTYSRSAPAGIRRAVILAVAGGLTVLLLVESFIVTLICKSLTRSKEAERRHTTRGYKIIFAAAVATLVWAGLIAAHVWAQPDSAVPSAARYVWSMLGAAMFLLFIYGLPLYARNRPSLAGSRRLARAYGLMMVVGLPLMILIWQALLGDEMPWPFYVLQVVLGATVIFRAYEMWRDRSWYFAEAVSFLSPSKAAQEAERGEELLEWLNRELPNEADQKTLAAALAGKYPGARKAAFAGLTYMAGVGTQAIIKGVDAIYEKVVQDSIGPYLDALGGFIRGLVR